MNPPPVIIIGAAHLNITIFCRPMKISSKSIMINYDIPATTDSTNRSSGVIKRRIYLMFSPAFSFFTVGKLVTVQKLGD
jgi:hypothetical protein